MTERAERRLAAIVAADVAGYSRLIGVDEEGTLAALHSSRRELLDPLIAEHGGRIANTAGDSLLLEFASVVDAVRYAVDMQRGMTARYSDVASDRRLQFRVGVHLGDVVVSAGDLLGDGVNIAARIESVATPAGIAISDDAYRQVRGRLDAEWRDGGEHDLKNIAHPVQIWRWREGESAPLDAPPTRPDKPSLAVLPFANRSADPAQDYFTDGMTEDIITDLSKVSALFVIARNTTFAYKGQRPEVSEVCLDLGVRYVLEGSVRRAGDQVRISAQLVDGDAGGEVWAERYDRGIEDVFAVQDEVTREIVAALRVELTPAEEQRRESRPEIGPEVRDLLYRARTHIYHFGPDAIREARALVEEAIAIDPNAATAHGMLALIHNANYLNRWNDWHGNSVEDALACARRATEIDPNDAMGRAAEAYCHIWRGDLASAETAAQRCLELEPNPRQGLSALGQVRDFQGRHAEAVPLFEQAFRLDPQFDLALLLLGRAFFALARDGEAEASFEARLQRNPNTDTTRAYLAAVLGQTGRGEAARQVWTEMLEINPEFDAARMRDTLPYAVPTWFDRFYEGLAKAEISV